MCKSGHTWKLLAVMANQPSTISGGLTGGSSNTTLPQKPDEILVSSTDAEAWNLEVERVAPHLKV